MDYVQIIADVAEFFRSFYAQIQELLAKISTQFGFMDYTREVEETGDGK